MLLKGKNAIIYGGGGSVGGAVARAFAREGARVFLAGRTRATLETVADQIRAAGGAAETAEVDALDERSVDKHAAAVATGAGSIDVSLNVISDGDVQGTPMIDMPLEDYLRPVTTSVSSKFLTSRAAARHMAGQRSGVIMTFGGPGDRGSMRGYDLGGLLVAFDAVESMRRQLASELSPYGIRVVTLQTGGLPETIPAGSGLRAAIEGDIVGRTLTGRAASLEDVGNVAVFAASDWARTVTGSVINMTCGAVLD
ncbi:SDR family NAD(P)-dependent oxidoreductase [Streptosporangium lutulentum]|uniref:NAD(P)-dependent dehydrogenase (Short-subunit alcohol dehydrogenase family) n=1 Tax=Streptosporangium lutulentum TaxID=1461250 RepID=A0ABT9Q7A3_9ACTN|nr:SDR family oxidoreductase [Streptosporangium lutulentum]MDP9842618.1 NAD(P)-dependent dehydrogenase (short-subunit alcohol dehydrogenase family) [Streptosporangium lutulentum]